MSVAWSSYVAGHRFVDQQTRPETRLLSLLYSFSFNVGLRRRTSAVIRDNPAAGGRRAADTTLSDKHVSTVGHDWSSLHSPATTASPGTCLDLTQRSSLFFRERLRPTSWRASFSFQCRPCSLLAIAQTFTFPFRATIKRVAARIA